MLPAIIARFWARDITIMIAVAVGAAALCGYAGLLVSYHANLPSGPAIILTAGRALCGLGCHRTGWRAHLAGFAAPAPGSVTGAGRIR